jgi:ADP-heptose:LPS heptosyltransferase
MLTYQRLNRKKLFAGRLLRYVFEILLRLKPKNRTVTKPNITKHAVIYESDYFGDLISCLPFIEYVASEYDKVTVIARSGLNAAFCDHYGLNVLALDLPSNQDHFVTWWFKIYKSRKKLSKVVDNCDVYETRGDLRNFLILSVIQYTTFNSFNLTIPRHNRVRLFDWPNNKTLSQTKFLLAENVLKKNIPLERFQKKISSTICQIKSSTNPSSSLRIFYHPGASQRHKRLTGQASYELIRYLSELGEVTVIEPPDLDLTELKHQLGPQIKFMSYDLTEFTKDVQHCNLYIGMDSGFTHLAAAAGIKTVVIFWHSQFSDFLPYGSVTPVVAMNNASSICNTGALTIPLNDITAITHGL